MVQPPAMAPMKPVSTKPRSQTQITSVLEKQTDAAALAEQRSSSVSGNGGVKPPPGKVRGQPAPPKPRPLPVPAVPKQSPVTGTNPPPPLPPPRKGNSTNGVVKGGPTEDYTLLENTSSPALG